MTTVVVLIGGAILSGCGGASAPSAPPTPPPPEVDVVQATVSNIREFRDYTGRTAAANSVEVRARVSGYLMQAPQSPLAKVHPATSSLGQDPGSSQTTAEPTSGSVDSPADAAHDKASPQVQVSEGEAVRRGDLLYLVDPEPYQLALRQAKGNLATALAQLQRFELELARTRELFESNSISRSDYDQAVANRAETQGQIESLEAALQRAQLDLTYTQVVAPIDGLLGRSQVTPGNLIAADSTLLTTIVSTAPIYVQFDVDERSVLAYRQRIRQGDVPSARDQPIPVNLGLATDDGFPHAGYIDFVDNQTDPTTGNTRVRATFPNADQTLSPGLFARVRVPFSSDYQAVLVPTKAIGTDQMGKYVMVVEDGKAQRRTVLSGMVKEGNTVIREGLSGQETVIVSGLQKVRPGSPVKPVPVASAPTETSVTQGQEGTDQ